MQLRVACPDRCMLKLLDAESVTIIYLLYPHLFLITVRYKHWGGGHSFIFAGTVLCKYNGVVICLCGWKLFYLQALSLYSACGLVAWELLFILFEKSVDNCHKWFCDAVKVCGCWQKVNFGIWAAVTQQSLNTGCEAGSMTRKTGQLIQLQLLSSQLRSFYKGVLGFFCLKLCPNLNL